LMIKFLLCDLCWHD